MTEDAARTVCYCVGVTHGELVAAIKAGSRSVEDLQRSTGACTGCHSCWPDIEALLREAGVTPTRRGR